VAAVRDANFSIDGADCQRYNSPINRSEALGPTRRRGVSQENAMASLEDESNANSTNKPSATGKILIVDDNAQNLELIQAYLEELPDAEISAATDGMEAIKLVARDAPDLILLDIMMPRMSGFEVCKKLKGDPKTADIPIIVITALSEISDIERAVECGTDDFLTKPVNKLELLTRVRSLLRLKHLKNELDRTLAYISELEGRRN
jgi:CheY-like chemotaxis protein